MDLRYIIVLSLIVVFFSVNHAFADSSSTPWRVIVKTDTKINGTSFWPQEMQARKGDTIQWINTDSVAHTVTSGVTNHPEYSGKVFDSGTINPGSTYSFKLPSDIWSAYYYYCKIHPWMTGKIDAMDAYIHQSSLATISTDKDAYDQNDIIQISGIINDTYQKMPAMIQIFDNQRNMVFSDQMNLTNKHTLEYKLSANNDIFKSDGAYKLKVFYGFPSVVTVVNFQYNSNPTSSNSILAIPVWIKNNAGWWASGQIDDVEFIKGIQYLIKSGDIKIAKTGSAEKTTDSIPVWVKNNADWWSKNEVSNQEFISSIQYLIDQGIIQI